MVYSTIDDSSIQPTIPEKLVKVVSGDLNTVGSIVSIGDEQFYVFGQEDGNVKLLSMYNLHVGNSVDEEWNVTPLTSPTGIQDSSARAFADGGYPLIGATSFSLSRLPGGNYSDYNGSIVEGYVNNYASYLEGLGANIEEARLITKEELETLGCSSDDETCSGAPEFVYKTSYWSGSVIDDYLLWTVISDRRLIGGDCYTDCDCGVRPVIIISESEF